MSTLNGLLYQFCQYLGLEAPKDNTDSATLDIKGITLHLNSSEQNKTPTLTIYSPLGAVPADYELPAYRAFLEANLFWSGTGDGTLGVNSSTREAYLAYHINTESLKNMDGEEFARFIAAFLEIVSGWKTFISQLTQANTAEQLSSVHSAMMQV